MGTFLAATNATAGDFCAVTEPLPAAEVETDEILSLACNLGWDGDHSILPCPALDPPVVVTGSELAQSVKLKAEVQEVSSPSALYWRAENGANLLWTTFQYDFEVVEENGVDYVYYVAPGLAVQSGHRFQVAFVDQDGTMSCLSERSIVIDTIGLTNDAPLPPANLDLMIEDEFRRFETNPKANDGDGLGPEGVWSWEKYTRIDADQEVGNIVASQSSDATGGCATYGKITEHQHAFAEVVFINGITDDDQGNPITDYNVEVFARKHYTGGVGFNGYYVKIQREPGLGINTARMRIGMFGSTGYTDLGEDDLVDIGCPNVIPLETEIGNTDRSEPVWLRIEVYDNAFLKPVVKGTLAWGCSSGNIENCNTYCEFSAVDSTDPAGLSGKKGATGFGTHHTDYFVDRFRVGWDE